MSYLNDKHFINKVLIIKTIDHHEMDKIVTCISKEKGRFMCIAKGARQMKSSKKAALETGNITKAYLIQTKSGWPILTQANLIGDCEEIRSSLPKIKQLMQLLEILDKIMVEDELGENIFERILLIRQLILNGSYGGRQIKEELYKLIEALGFQVPLASDQDKSGSLINYIAELTNSKMRSYDYLTVGE